jgi:arylsulfatase A-like enzyme
MPEELPMSLASKGVACAVLAALAALGTNASAADFARTSRPNLVFILADDLGYGDLACYGAPDVRTPNLDRLASEGVRLTDCYANESVCSPTRAAFMTGRYQQRIGLEWAVYYGVHGQGLPGLLGGNIHYFKHFDRLGTHDLFLDDKPVKLEGYATDLITDHAIAFIDQGRGRPFFLYLAYNAPHFPFQGPGDGNLLVTPGDKSWGSGSRERNYAPMVESLDANVGRLLKALEQRGLTRNTLVVFTSDNGGYTLSRNAPLRGGKGTLWEGGIRVPGIARWPGQIPSGVESPQVAVTMDWAVTFVALGGGTPPADRSFDGMDLAPLLTGKQPPQPRSIFWRRSPDPYRKGVVPQLAVRDGKWKYLEDEKGRYLFDLSQDIAEQRNLAVSQPAEVERLHARLIAWQAEIDPPLYDQRPTLRR